jgi:hypothetical protein
VKRRKPKGTYANDLRLYTSRSPGDTTKVEHDAMVRCWGIGKLLALGSDFKVTGVVLGITMA